MSDALDRAIEACKTQAELARRLSDIMGEPVAQQHVWNWRNRAAGKVPAEYCRAIEEATAGDVTRYDLRPDVFGDSPTEIAATGDTQ